MKKLSFFVILLFLMFSGTAFVNAQVTIGADAAPHPGAVLDLHSTTQGLLMPRVALSDVAVFGLAGTASTAVGMTVYNTNSGIINGKGVGVYVWDGNNWKVSAGGGGVGQPGVLDTIRGANGTYRIWCFPESTGLGCWMVDNSMEGTPSGRNYAGSAVYPSRGTGYYYTWAQAAAACPSGWALPNSTQWTSLMNYINGPYSSLEEKFWWTVGSAIAGNYDASTAAWLNLGFKGSFWSISSTAQYYFVQGAVGGPYTAGNFWLLVRCVKSN